APIIERLPRVAQRRGEAAPIVVAQVALMVIVLRDRHALLGQHLAEQLEVDRLVVHQHAVEVEDDRSDHGFYLWSRQWAVGSRLAISRALRRVPWQSTKASRIPPGTAHCPLAPSDRLRPPLAGADPDAVVHGEDEDLAVADSTVGPAPARLEDGV